MGNHGGFFTGGDPMFGFKMKKAKTAKRLSGPAARAKFALHQALSSGQRAPTGDRSELCAGAMNNNQRLATLQMLRHDDHDD